MNETIKFYPENDVDGIPKSCAFCGVMSFAHLHKPDTLPKDFERIYELVEESDQVTLSEKQDKKTEPKNKCDIDDGRVKNQEITIDKGIGKLFNEKGVLRDTIEKGIDKPIQKESEGAKWRIDNWKILWPFRDNPETIKATELLLEDQAKQIRREERFIGLTDKYGKKIYEGYKLRDSKGVGVVTWLDSRGGWAVYVEGEGYYYPHSYGEYQLKDTEIIE